MTTRTTRSTISFRLPFKLISIGEVLPAGDYQLETDEELMDSVSMLVYRRTNTLLRVPRGSGSEMFMIDPKELEIALLKDQQD